MESGVSRAVGTVSAAKKMEGDGGAATEKVLIEEVVLESDQENLEVAYVDVEGATKMKGKEAWKNHMGQMQKCQKEAGNNTAKKGSKAVMKRGLTQSPKPKSLYGKADKIHSPVKKNARTETGSSRMGTTSSALKEFINGTTVETATSSQSEAIRDSKLLLKTSSSKAPVIVPIFLPPAERKAIFKSSTMTSDTNDLLSSIIDSDIQTQSINEPEDPTKFEGNIVILNQQQIDKDPYEGNKTKLCPFYKKLPGVPLCVDAFNCGLIPGMEVYFLSHFHSDHYIGLSKKFCKTVICSYPTGNLVRMKLYVEEKCIRKLRMNKPYIICESEVTLVDANQYCSPQYDFSTQQQSIASVVSHVKRHIEYRPQTLVICGSYLIGKERVYFTLAEAIGSKVYGTYDKRKIINALEIKKFSSLLSSDDKIAQVHVVPMFSISAMNLQEYLAKYPQYTNIIGIKPSGWQFSSCGSGLSVKTHYGDSVTVVGVPYSEHSSFSELREFVINLKPKRVQPTVNVGNAKKRGEMMQHIESWLCT